MEWEAWKLWKQKLGRGGTSPVFFFSSSLPLLFGAPDGGSTENNPHSDV